MYSAEVLDHFEHPRNTGKIADPDAAAEIQNPVCGDVLRLTIKLHGDQIADIRFKAKGCVPSIACASAMTELLRGKNLRDARLFRREALVEALGELPPASTHAVQLALDALSAALDLAEASRSVAVQGSRTK